MSELRLFTCPYGFSYRQRTWMLISIARGDRLATSTSASLAEFVRSKTMQAPTSNLVMSQPERRMPTANTWALLVEDDAEIGALIARYLEANQISVTVVETGEELAQEMKQGMKKGPYVAETFPVHVEDSYVIVEA